MINNEQEYSTYRFYDEKGRRLSLFARKIDEHTLEIFKLTCSKKDQFSRAVGIGAYHNFTYCHSGPFHPEVIIIYIENGNKPKYEFLKFCNENFFKKYTHKVWKTEEVLAKGRKGKLNDSLKITQYHDIRKSKEK